MCPSIIMAGFNFDLLEPVVKRYYSGQVIHFWLYVWEESLFFTANSRKFECIYKHYYILILFSTCIIPLLRFKLQKTFKFKPVIFWALKTICSNIACSLLKCHFLMNLCVNIFTLLNTWILFKYMLVFTKLFNKRSLKTTLLCIHQQISRTCITCLIYRYIFRSFNEY